MSLFDSVLKFIASKWFTFCLGIALMFVLPFTWHNFEVVWKAGQLTSFWWVVGVFIINVISILLCVYKFMGMLGQKSPAAAQEW